MDKVYARVIRSILIIVIFRELIDLGDWPKVILHRSGFKRPITGANRRVHLCVCKITFGGLLLYKLSLFPLSAFLSYLWYTLPSAIEIGEKQSIINSRWSGVTHIKSNT